MTSLVDKIAAISTALDAADIPYAFGGALALAWCTGEPRGTVDIDLNLFTAPGRAKHVLRSLPTEVQWSDADLASIRRDGQVRIWWDRTPVDVFFDTTDFHRAARARVRHQVFAGRIMPFLACADLAVFKAFFDRTKDWADLEEMAGARSFDVEAVVAVLAEYLGPDDARIERLRDVVRRFGS